MIFSYAPYLYSFRTPQLRASRTRVAHRLLLAGLDHVFRKHAERSCPLSLLKRTLHQSIFPRVIAQHHPAASSKPPSRPRPRPPRESPTLARPPQSSRTERAPASLSPQRS